MRIKLYNSAPYLQHCHQLQYASPNENRLVRGGRGRSGLCFVRITLLERPVSLHQEKVVFGFEVGFLFGFGGRSADGGREGENGAQNKSHTTAINRRR